MGTAAARATSIRRPSDPPHRTDLLTDKHKDRPAALFKADEHVEVEATWGIYQLKVSIHKLAPIPLLHGAVQDPIFERLAIADAHLIVLQDLPQLHRDPFDRLLISQALVERLTFLTVDSVFSSFAVPVIDARI